MKEQYPGQFQDFQMQQAQAQQQPMQQQVPSPAGYMSEEEVTNIVGQIDPQRILDNLNHSLKGEYFNKEKGSWEKVGDELVNTSCRGWIVSQMTSFMNNASTMGILQEQQVSYLMEGVIGLVTKEFRCNLELFGFVPPGKYYTEGKYENKGNPNTSRMNSVSEMIYRAALLVLTRSLKGTESSRIFKSLSMNDSMIFNQQEQQKKGFLGKIFS